VSTSWAQTDDLRIAVHDHGGDGPDLLLSHATGFHGHVWLPWVEALRASFRVVAYDQRGHGDSDKPGTGYAWDGFGRDVLAVADHLGLDRPAALGHSAGATALILAESSRPGTFSRLVLMDPVLAPPELRELAAAGANPMADAARRRRSVWDSPGQMVERLQQGSPLSAWRNDFLRAYVEGGTAAGEGGVELKCSPEVEAQVYEMGMRQDGWERLGDLGLPVLFAVGEDSPMWAGGRAEQATAGMSDVEVAVLAGGHFFPMENPDATLNRVLSFLRSEP
jgi:pimeloyl-ACP methyl ester carboxylesterase